MTRYARAMRRTSRSTLLLASLSFACMASEPADPPESASPSIAVEAEPHPAPQAEGDEYFFAVLGQSGVEHCPRGQASTWLDVQPTLGFVPAGGAAMENQDLGPLMDQPVLARGTSMAAPPRAPSEIEVQPCPPMQMRSDWVNTPRGIRVRRAATPKIEHFHVTSVRRLDELAVTRDGQELVVSFRNPLPFALVDVRLVMHYEGCYGKPGSTSRTTEPIELAPGAEVTHRFPLTVDHEPTGPRKGSPNAREHRAADLVLELGEPREGATVHADLSVSLRDLGLEFGCP
jgi:hypothetical protein